MRDGRNIDQSGYQWTIRQGEISLKREIRRRALLPWLANALWYPHTLRDRG
jgi:hypothetical protein